MVEETLKWASFVLLWGSLPQTRRALDVVSGAAALGLGFAAMENLYGLGTLSGGELLVRSITSPFVHMLLATVWALGLIPRAEAAWRTALRAALSLAAAALLHGAYDFATLHRDLVTLSALLLVPAWLTVSSVVEHAADERRRRQAPALAVASPRAELSSPSPRPLPNP